MGGLTGTRFQKLPMRQWFDFLVNGFVGICTHLTEGSSLAPDKLRSLGHTSDLNRRYNIPVSPEQRPFYFTVHLNLNQVAHKFNGLGIGYAPLFCRCLLSTT